MRKSAMMFAAAMAAAGFVATISDTARAASEFEGRWLLKDTSGAPFEIALSADGKVTGARGAKVMSGTWKEANGIAVISWSDGWTTTIEKSGNAYEKTAYKGEPGGTPVNTSDAVRK